MQSQVVDTFDAAATHTALKAIHRGRMAMAAFGAAAVIIGAVVLCEIAGNDFPPLMILGGGAFFAVLLFIGSLGNKAIRQSQYYSLPGSRFGNGDHRCIFCGMRAKDGRGIYTHGQYKSSAKFHECSKCKKGLFTS